jgi:hypothetical protein
MFDHWHFDYWHFALAVHDDYMTAVADAGLRLPYEHAMMQPCSRSDGPGNVLTVRAASSYWTRLDVGECIRRAIVAEAGVPDDAVSLYAVA